MEKSSDVSSDVLLVRHLPGVLTEADQTELLKHFGATQVKCIGNKGPLKYCAFAKFKNTICAKEALKRLHQFSILGRTLCVEFSRKSFHEIQGTSDGNKIDKCVKESPEVKSSDSPDVQKVQDCVDGISEKWSVRYLLNPKLRYVYPPPSASILTNIANALATVPKFYVQVLHLMNKMNLPAPFGVVTPTPPIPHEPPPLPKEEVPLPEEPVISEVEMQVSSEESELETDSDSEKRLIRKTAQVQLKRKKEGPILDKKKMRLSNVLPPVVSKSQVQPTVKPNEIFDQPSAASARKSGFKFGQIGTAQETTELEVQVYNLNKDEVSETLTAKSQSNQANIEEGGFGKLEPIASNKDAENEKSDEEAEEWGAGKFISYKRLRRGRLSSRDMKELNVFKNYNAGEPTTRLYIKNVAKQTSEKDLHYIFGRYVNWDNDSEKNMFDIRLMKEGRMKGQCFITLGSEKQAQTALDETNGFQLNGKPMVVQFARSAKPKETDKSSK